MLYTLYLLIAALHSDRRTANLYISDKKGKILWLSLPGIDFSYDNKFEADCLTMEKLEGKRLMNIAPLKNTEFTIFYFSRNRAMQSTKCH